MTLEIGHHQGNNLKHRGDTLERRLRQAEKDKPQDERRDKTGDRARAMNELERYERQQRIWGQEGQERLAKAVVTIVGDSHCAKYTALPLAALGVGQVRILGGRKSEADELFLDLPLGLSGDTYAVQGYAHVLSRVNPAVTLASLPLDFNTRLGQAFLKDSQVIVEATNNPQSKAVVFEYARSMKIPVITAGVAESYAKLMLWNPQQSPPQNVELSHLMPQYEGIRQGSLVSLLWGGLIAEEVKKIILGDENILNTELYYKQGGQGRFTYHRKEEPILSPARDKFAKKRAFVIGCGALGNILSIALAEMGFHSVDYIDYDAVESHNLNRQVLFYDAVGLSKAKVLARKHKKMNPQAAARGVVEKFEVKHGAYTLDTLRKKRYDVGFDVVDNLYTRAMIAAYSVLRETPLIKAASSPEAAQVAVYVPGETPCMDHIFGDYYERGRREEIIRRQSCIAQPDPSVVMTNQVGAALAALEACPLFDRRYGTPLRGSLKYDTKAEARLGVIPVAQACDCHLHKERIPNLEIEDNLKLEDHVDIRPAELKD